MTDNFVILIKRRIEAMKKTHLAGLLAPALLAACMGGGDGTPASSPSGSDNGTTQAAEVGRVFLIEPGPQATQQMVEAMVQLKPKDILRFDCGFFDLKEGLQITQTEDVVVEGCGKDETFLSFANSTGQEGLLASNVQQILVQDLTIGDSPGDAFKLKSVNHGQLLNVRAIWSSGRKTEEETLITEANWKDEIQVECKNPVVANPASSPPDPTAGEPGYIVSNLSGRYGIYPVESRNILVRNTESIGASDAGIYVGQTNIAKIQDSRAAYNVFGFEIENVQDGEYSGNLAECNTGGFLVYDLDGLTRYGKRSRMFDNVSRNNNTYNFATPGSIVANVPRGSGFITLAYDKIDIYNNVFEDHGTAGIILTSYELLGIPGDRRMDYYTEGVNIFNNTFKNNGNDLPNPDFAAIVATQGGQVTSAFPALVGLKNAAGGDQYGYSGAHIVWDGYEDELNADCPPPVDNNGEPVPVDEEGKPIQGNQFPNPDCVYNAYKFDNQNERIVPTWWFSCIHPNNNTFDADSREFANFHGTRGLEAVFAAAEQDASVLSVDGFMNVASGIMEFRSDFDMSQHDCLARFGADLPRLPDFEFEEYVPTGTIPPAINE
ncbi:MAG: parallel beta-helix domain-containing protein, partial [Limnobacter sp.]|nr:parallel beta-helix domain-containing protein [Limnobacter sp.]